MDTYILLCTALELKNTKVAKLILTSSSKDNKNSTSSNSPLHFAILNDDVEIIEMFLDEGANAENFNGKTVLHDAVESMKTEVINTANRSSKKIMNLRSRRVAIDDDNGNDAVTFCHIAADTGKDCPPLHLAVDKGNEEITELFLSKGANVNARGRHDTTALHIAAEKGHSTIVKLLLKHGADVNSAYTSTSREGYTSLHLAVENQHEEITRLLLNSGANVDATANDGTTSLHIATEKGYLQTVKNLLNAGADVNSAYTAKTRHGYTSLHLAVENQHEEITRLLLNSGANVDATANDGTTSLHIATEKGYLQTVKNLLNAGADVNSAYTAKTRHGYTPLHLAVENQHEPITRLLLSKGANVDAKGDAGTTSLYIATEKRDLTIIKHLLKHGADVNSAHTARHGYTPVHLAAEIGDEEIIKLLLSSGRNVDAKGDSGVTSLHIATERGYFQIVRLLLTHGADVNSAYISTIREGYTSLLLAAAKGDEEITELFLSKGANVNARGRHDTTALHIATEKGHSTIVRLLLKHGADVNSAYTSSFREGYTSLHLAAEKGDKEISKLLLCNGANVNAKEIHGMSALHLATQCGHSSIVDYLLIRGACVDSVSRKGHTPLHLAVENKREKIVKLLLESGANVDVEDKGGKTILLLAVEKGNIKMVEYILRYHPDLNNRSNRSVLNVATQYDYRDSREIVKYLLRYGFTVNPKDVNNVMYAAVENRHFQLVKVLLKHGTDVNMLCNTAWGKGYTPLHVAIKYGQRELAEFLIRCGADVNAQDETGRPPIFYASKNADSEMIKLLLANKANVKNNPELLNNAVREEDREIVEDLLQHGADVNGSDKYGRMPLHFIILDNDKKYCDTAVRLPGINVKTEIAKLLLSRGANANTRIENSVTILHAAIEKEYVKVVEALLEYDADVNSTCQSDMTPLLLSAVIGNDEIVEMLLNKGANIIAEGPSAQYALISAVNGGSTKVVELLLKCGAKVNPTIKDVWWDALLNNTAFGRHTDIVELLVKFGADVNLSGDLGCTSLDIATRKGYTEIVTILLEHGADITIMNNYNHTVLNIAMNVIKGSQATSIFENFFSHDVEVANYVNIAEILKRHMVKIKATNLYAVNKYVLSISSDDEEESNFLNESDEVIARVYSKKVRMEKRLARYDFQDECEKEVASLKSEKFVNTCITMYDILTKDTSQLAMYAKNESIVEAFKSGDYKIKFPIYASMIYRNFRNGEKRKEFLERGKKIFYSFFKNFPELPHVCTEKIFSYLNDEDVRVLIDDYKLIELC